MTAILLPQVSLPTTEQRLLLSGVSWQQYELFLATLGDDFPGLRLSYLEGNLEIMTTSPEHEELKKIIGMLLELYFQECRIRFHAMGAATFRKALKMRGLEPDECYCFAEKKEFPDLAIEIVLSSGLINKLDIYQGLGVSEVWQWKDGQFWIYHLRSDGYQDISNSELLPNLDIALLASYVRPEDQYDAVMEWRDRLRSDNQ